MPLNIGIPQDPFDIRPKITVIGVGGAGGNAVNNMIRSNLEGVEFLIANTDAQALQQSLCERRLQLGGTVTKGLGAGARPDVGRMAAEEAMREIAEQLAGSNMAFITAGMGGGTGTGAAPVVAQIAREQGILTVGVVTKPFHFEGAHRMRLAEAGIQELQQYVDTLIIIPNQNLFRVANEKTTFADAFKMADEVLNSGVRGVTDLMVMPGLINLDFADIRAVMGEMGKAMMGTGEASGDNRAIAAAEAAISNPLLDEVSMKGARGVLINITGGLDMTLFEVDEAANRIRDEVDPDANIIFGSTFDQSLDGKIRISVVATGIESQAQVMPRPAALSVVARNPNPQPSITAATAPSFVAAVAEDRGQARMDAPVHPAARAGNAGVAHYQGSTAQGMPGMGFTASIGATALQSHPVTHAMPQPVERVAERPQQPQAERVMPERIMQERVQAEPAAERRFVAPQAMEPVQRQAEPVRDRAPMPAATQPTAQHVAQPVQQRVSQPAYAQPQQPQQQAADPVRKPSGLFDKMAARLSGHAARPAAPVQAPAPATARQAPAPRNEPSLGAATPAQQPSLKLDPADRLGGQRTEEAMLKIPTFLRRQAN